MSTSTSHQSDISQESVPGKAALPLPVYISALFVCSLILTGYRVYYGNHAIQLPLVDVINDPSLYPKDPFAESLPYYASLLWRLVALCARVVDVEVLLIVLFMFERLLVICAAAYLAKTLVPNSDLAAVGAMAMFALAPRPLFGNGTIVVPYFEQTGFAIPFFLLAMAAFYRQSRIVWAVCVAIGFNLNSMYGTYAMTYFFAAFLVDSRHRQAWRKWAVAVAVFAICALPAVYFTLKTLGREAGDSALWVKAGQARFWHHLNPLAWRKLRLIEFAILMVLFAGTLWHNRKTYPRLFAQGMAWAAVGAGWVVYAFLAAYVFRSSSTLVMQPARGMDLCYCFLGIAMISMYAANVEEEKERRGFLVTALFACIFIWQPIVHTGIPFFLMAVLVLLPWDLTWHHVFRDGSPRRVSLLITVFVLLLAGWSFRSRQTSDDSYNAPWIGRPDSETEKIAEWARENTSVNATFLVNPTWPVFRALARRPVFTTWKDGSAILWDRSFVDEWVRRLRAIGIGELKPRQSMDQLSTQYEQLDDQDVERLKRQYGLAYWVTSQDHRSSFPIVFQSRDHTVYILE